MKRQGNILEKLGVWHKKMDAKNEMQQGQVD